MALTPKAFADIITFTRASGGGRFNSAGVYEFLASNAPRLDHDPVTLLPRGLLIEEQRTRLNTISALPVAAQNVTVAAAPNTISFYGTGSLDFTGVHIATIAGTGAYPSRRTYTFTPTAGILTITPTGDVQGMQLELGAFATSLIVGEGTQVTRAADVASVNTLSPWYNASEGTVVVDFTKELAAIAAPFVFAGDSNNYLGGSAATATSVRGFSRVGGITEASPAIEGFPAGARYAFAYKQNDIGISANGSAPVVDNLCEIPSGLSLLGIGRTVFEVPRAMHIRSIKYYPRRLTNDELQAITL